MVPISETGKSVALRLGRQSVVFSLSLALLIATFPLSLAAQDAQAPPPDQDNQEVAQNGPAPGQNNQAPPYAQQTPEQLQRLVAPIALYPASLGCR